MRGKRKQYKYGGHSLSKAKIKPSHQIRRRLSDELIMEIEHMYSIGFGRRYIAAHLGVSYFSVWLYTMHPQHREEYLAAKNAKIFVSQEKRREYSRRRYARKQRLYELGGLTFYD